MAALIKIKMLLDMRALQQSIHVPQLWKTPREMADHIRYYIPNSDIIFTDRPLLEESDYSQIVRELERQVIQWYATMQELIPEFWSTLVDLQWLSFLKEPPPLWN